MANALPDECAEDDEVRERGRVLIVDDSAVMRAVLQRTIDAADRYVVAGAVPHADAAIEFLQHSRVDLILLDLEMPGVGGLSALPDLVAMGQGARVLVVSSVASDGAVATVQALALGAADTLVKPSASVPFGLFAAMLVERLDRLMDNPVPNTVAVRPAPAPTPALPAMFEPIAAAADKRVAGDYQVVAIGASTGGIHALGQLLRQLPSSFCLPIIVTQHLPPTFMPFFAAQVAVLANRPCDVAIDRMRLMPGRIVVAPGHAHIRLVSIGDGKAAIRLSYDPAVSGCMPSVDPMFESVAEVFGARALAIVLSGMGRDGAEGARAVRAAGGSVVVQDQETSVVWGMPGAVAAAGLADAIMPADAIGTLVAEGRRP